MKTAVIFVALIATCAAMDVSRLMDLASKAEEMYMTCVQKPNLSGAAIYNLLTAGGLEDKETNEARACMMKISGTMVDKKISLAKAEEKMNACPWMGAHPEVKNTILGVMKGCQKAANAGATEAEVAGKWNMCFKALAEKMIGAAVVAVLPIIAEAAKAGA